MLAHATAEVLTLAHVSEHVVADPAAERLRGAMERYARGDDSAFAELYDGLAPRLAGFLQRMTRDNAKTDDLLQQTFLNIHRARGRFTPGADVLPWAFAIARRLFLDGTRRGKREVLERGDPSEDESQSLFELLESLGPSQDELVDAKSLAALLRTELDRLPEQQREAFELIKQEGLSVADAASILGTTVGAVKLRAHRAYETLRASLTKKGRAPS
jgi:RNA polymerase sigma-70 factor (ECF subfamily)